MTTTTTIPMSAAQGANPLKGLLAYGQSPWLDFIRRNILLNGDLKKMINEDGLRGMTSNPAIFEKAITAGDDYNDIIKAADAKSSTAMALYEKNRHSRRAGRVRHLQVRLQRNKRPRRLR